MSKTYYKYTLTDEQKPLIEYIDQHKRIICLDNVYLQFINIYDKKNLNILYQKCKKSYTLYCLGINEVSLYTELTEDKMKIIHNINDSDNHLTFRLKTSKTFQNIINTDEINVCITKNKLLRNIIHKIGNPILGLNANIYNDIYYTNLNNLLKDYVDTDICIYNQENDDSVGIENSIIKINENTCEYIHKSFIDEHVQKSIFEGINFIPDTKFYFNDIVIYKLHIIDLSNDHFIINQKSNHLFKQKFLDNSVFIDFNGKLRNYQDKFYIYVDLSSKGDYKEALFNLYNILYQVKDNKSSLILFNNIDNITSSMIKTENQNYYRNMLLSKIDYICCNKNTALPFQCLIND
jgi:tRNA A37 threonylcarbamoyladenosine synthetase subunit TsaC/SUA5/YrdC